MYNLRRLFCKPWEIISDRKEMKPFQTKLNVSPRTGARGAGPEAGLFSYLCGQKLSGKAALLAFKTHVCDNIIGSFLPPSGLQRESLGISKCHVKCFSCPALTQKRGARWIQRRPMLDGCHSSKGATVILSPLFCSLPHLFRLSKVTFSL